MDDDNERLLAWLDGACRRAAALRPLLGDSEENPPTPDNNHQEEALTDMVSDLALMDVLMGEIADIDDDDDTTTSLRDALHLLTTGVSSSSDEDSEDEEPEPENITNETGDRACVACGDTTPATLAARFTCAHELCDLCSVTAVPLGICRVCDQPRMPDASHE